MSLRMLLQNIWISYKTWFRLLGRTFLAGRRSPARRTPKRLAIMTGFLLLLLVIQTLHWLGFIIDELVFSGYRKIKVRQPLFVVGVPRSGTTFLHRLLFADKELFTCFTLWELIFAPSITERKIILGLARLDRVIGAPLQKAIAWLERRLFGSLDDIHVISLSDAEEDYFVLTPIYACFLLILPFPFFDELGHLAFFDDQTPQAEQDRILAFYKSCLQRHLYVRGTDRVLLSKNVSFSPMIRALNRVFPDCRIIGTVRDPRRAVPSHLSSMMEGAAVFDNNVEGDDYRDRMIEVQRYAYTHVIEALPELPRERRLTVRMEGLQHDLYGVVSTIYDRFDYAMMPDVEYNLRRRNQIQKTYQSGHHYDMAAYGLTGEEIFSRFADVFQQFGYEPPNPDISRVDSGVSAKCRTRS
ncbi:MAG: sulfotransferase [Desulfosudaceae bacterium]